MKPAFSLLVVEDDRDLASIMKRFLESEGFAVDVAGSAEEAYELLGHAGYALIVLDVNLPSDDGITLCRHVRASTSTPVIFASARIGDEARALALESGGDAYLSKPFSLRELLAQVKAVLSRTGAGAGANAGTMAHVPAPTTAAHGLSLDAHGRQICKDGSPVALSPKEYELAAVLMGHPGQAIAKQQLLAEVWGPFAEVEPQTLAVHMSWLRSKLEDDPAHPTRFETVRGFGYRYNPREQAAGQRGRR